jgi:hypothetical protein
MTQTGPEVRGEVVFNWFAKCVLTMLNERTFLKSGFSEPDYP